MMVDQATDTVVKITAAITGIIAKIAGDAADPTHLVHFTATTSTFKTSVVATFADAGALRYAVLGQCLQDEGGVNRFTSSTFSRVDRHPGWFHVLMSLIRDVIALNDFKQRGTTTIGMLHSIKRHNGSCCKIR